MNSKSQLDTFQQLTQAKQRVEIQNGVHFRLACCDCHLVHNVTVTVKGLKIGTPIEIRIRRNERATKFRRKLKENQ